MFIDLISTPFPLCFDTQKLPNSELSEIVLKELRRRYNGRSSLQQTELETAQQSMELMRQNVQELFDSEIQVIVQKYIDVSNRIIRLNFSIQFGLKQRYFDFQTYFEPALKNIKENLENSGITDQYVGSTFRFTSISVTISTRFLTFSFPVEENELRFARTCKRSIQS